MIKLCDLSFPVIDVLKAISNVVDSGVFVKGPKVEEFEELWAQRCGKKYCVAVGSGAQALELAIQCIWGIGAQSTITYTKQTYKAVPNAIRRMGHIAIATTDYADIFAHHLHDEQLTSTPQIEDCSHCHGYMPVATTAIFSFYPTKILGAMGDAGAIVTDDPLVYRQAQELRNHGELFGTNARMDELQAAILTAKLPYLDVYISMRKAIVEMYDEILDRQTPGDFHYAYCIPGSQEKADKLKAKGIQTGFYYTEEYMALPLHVNLTTKEVREVTKWVLRL